jgi:hypothetical protein
MRKVKFTLTAAHIELANAARRLDDEERERSCPLAQCMKARGLDVFVCEDNVAIKVKGKRKLFYADLPKSTIQQVRNFDLYNAVEELSFDLELPDEVKVG